MYCRNCGKQLDDQASVCTNCGVATSNHVQHKSETNTIAIIGFILSFLSVSRDLFAVLWDTVTQNTKIKTAREWLWRE